MVAEFHLAALGPLYTTTLPGETDKIFYQMYLLFRRRRRFWGLKTRKNEPTLQSGNLKNAPPSRSRLKGVLSHWLSLRTC